MKGKCLIPFICLWLAAPGYLAAGEVNRSWDELERIIVLGKNVAVTRMNAVVVEGKLTNITADSITVQEEGALQTIERGDVFRVRYAGIRKKHALWGMAIGAAVGAVGLTIIDSRSTHPHASEAAPFGALVFGLGPGAIVGGALPLGMPLYEAEKVVRKGP